MGVQRQASHLGLRDHDTRGVGPLVQLGLDAKAGGGARVANELHERLKGPERLAAPVLRDVAEEAMLNLVPLAGPRREVADPDAQAEVIGECLQFRLPAASPVAVAAARVGRNQEFLRLPVPTSGPSSSTTGGSTRRRRPACRGRGRR